MENSNIPHPRRGYFYINPKLVEQNDRKKSSSSSSSVRRTDDYRSYQLPKQYLLRERPDLESENLVIYQRKVAPEELSDKELARITQAKKFLRCPGLQFGFCPPEGKCLICSLDEHTSWDCPYALEIPTKNAIVTTDADIVCKKCDNLLLSGGRCPVCLKQALGRARLIFCPFCRTFGERSKQQCPHHPTDPEQILRILQQ